MKSFNVIHVMQCSIQRVLIICVIFIPFFTPLKLFNQITFLDSKIFSSRPYSWAFPKTFHMPFVELLAISERAAAIAIATGKKIGKINYFFYCLQLC